ncbi:MAG: phenylalanine--tRNA ligase subunit alpha [Candidatus Bathyarchaeia archaeon]|nr:phenylalanine--tRNA ligase subunit alpha [Candidatus Bathyarchaeia archaeon]
MVKLREQEHKVLLSLKKFDGKASIEQIIAESGLSDAAVMRAALALQERKLLKIHEEKQIIVKLNEEGKFHAKNGLPERRLINALEELGKKAPIEKVVEKASLEKHFTPIALGWIQKKHWAILDTKTNALQMLEKPKEEDDERLLRLLSLKGQETIGNLSPELQKAVQILKRRKLLETEEKAKRIIALEEVGWKTIKKGVKVAAEVTQLTPELIISGKWRKIKLQKYNIEAPVAKTWPGKKHPYLQFLDEVEEKLVTLGFKEMTGPTVETSFFNFDALYTPQDHPAREIFGVYFVKSPKYGHINAGRHVLENVKETHENGWKTGSRGWRYRYSLKESGHLILRGHGTCLSARTLLSKDLEIPGRYFSIVRCYRPEVVDKTHLTEFNQVEGIIVDKDLTLRDLLGVLEKFAIEIAGADEVKFRPDYFPFTEPSVELSAYKKGYGWIEFGGSGIFRPEVTLPLGIEVPVIAWGLGIDRLFMMKAGIDDIRQIFTYDLDWIRRKQVV